MHSSVLSNPEHVVLMSFKIAADSTACPSSRITFCVSVMNSSAKVPQSPRAMISWTTFASTLLASYARTCCDSCIYFSIFGAFWMNRAMVASMRGRIFLRRRNLSMVSSHASKSPPLLKGATGQAMLKLPGSGGSVGWSLSAGVSKPSSPRSRLFGAPGWVCVRATPGAWAVLSLVVLFSERLRQRNPLKDGWASESLTDW